MNSSDLPSKPDFKPGAKNERSPAAIVAEATSIVKKVTQGWSATTVVEQAEATAIGVVAALTAVARKT